MRIVWRINKKEVQLSQPLFLAFLLSSITSDATAPTINSPLNRKHVGSNSWLLLWLISSSLNHEFGRPASAVSWLCYQAPLFNDVATGARRVLRVVSTHIKINLKRQTQLHVACTVDRDAVECSDGLRACAFTHQTVPFVSICAEVWVWRKIFLDHISELRTEWMELCRTSDPASTNACLTDYTLLLDALPLVGAGVSDIDVIADFGFTVLMLLCRFSHIHPIRHGGRSW